jgi:hypothetical protein
METKTQNQPLRVNIQCSFTIESEIEAQSHYEEIKTFIKGIRPTAIISANIFKMLSPCCGEKKP